MVDFSGWEMPLHYGSQLKEHLLVRNSAGMFDVSHMQVVDVRGPGARAFLRFLLANDVGRLKEPGRALYSCMLNEQGGVLDDLIVYFVDDMFYRVVVNAGTAAGDIAWMQAQAGGFDVRVEPREDLAIVAVQGPEARSRVQPVLDEDVRQAAAELAPFHAVSGREMFVARTGYTGEDGFEVILPAPRAAGFWQALVRAGVGPAGLGARDTLRLEAGLNLYGQDMDRDVTPLESGLGWTVAWEPAQRRFIGREALEAQRDDPARRKFVGLVFHGKGVLRAHQKVSVDGRVVGEVTSGSFSPVLGRSIALARVARDVGPACQVAMRGKWVPVQVVRPPFVRHGKVCIDLGSAHP